MIDNFSLAISHGLLLIVAIRLLMMPETDRDESPVSDQPAAEAKDWTTRDA